MRKNDPKDFNFWLWKLYRRLVMMLSFYWAFQPDNPNAIVNFFFGCVCLYFVAITEPNYEEKKKKEELKKKLKGENEDS